MEINWKTMDPGPARDVNLNGRERLLILEALAGLSARSADPSEVLAAMKVAQHIEGFDIERLMLNAHSSDITKGD